VFQGTVGHGSDLFMDWIGLDWIGLGWMTDLFRCFVGLSLLQQIAKR